MRLEDQVVSLELAKKLKELGAKQESAFYWSRINGKFVQLLAERECQYELTENDGVERFSAYTVAELGQELIIGTDTMWDGQKWQVSFGDHERAWSVRDDSEADARAKMLVYLIENCLV